MTLGEIIDVPINGIRSIRNQHHSLKFMQLAFMVGGNSKTGVRKKFLNGEF